MSWQSSLWTFWRDEVWACLEEPMARSLTAISLLLQSTTHCCYRVYTKFLLTYTAIYRGNRKVLPLGITALQPQSHFHLGTPYNLPCKKITLNKPEGRRRVGRPNLRWMDGVMRDAERLESEIGGSRPRTEMVGGDFLSRPRPCMGCSAWEWVSEWDLGVAHMIQFTGNRFSTSHANLRLLHIFSCQI